jgi:3D (Asp-Asp-Asp) domain-containing protein
LPLIIALFTASAASGGEIYPAQKNYHTVSETVRYVTAYNVGDPKQNYGDPCISANGENICKALALGAKRCAANFVPFGTELFIQAYGICVVTDRTNSRYRNRVDIAMKTYELRKAKQFGKKKLYVKILKRAPSESHGPDFQKH